MKNDGPLWNKVMKAHDPDNCSRGIREIRARPKVPNHVTYDSPNLSDLTQIFPDYVLIGVSQTDLL